MNDKTTKPAAPAQRRLPGKQRRLAIARVAADLFAAHGFSVSTRRISEELGISQAALYKHFSSKEAIIDEVFRVRYLQEKPSDFSSILHTSPGPLLERLTLAYLSFFGGITETSLKLFQRASYDGLDIAKRYSPHLDERILWPVLETLRDEVKLAPLAVLPASTHEREMALMLHSSIVFLAMRKFVYRIDFKGQESQLIREYVSIWLAGALIAIRDYHRS